MGFKNKNYLYYKELNVDDFKFSVDIAVFLPIEKTKLYKTTTTTKQLQCALLSLKCV